MPASPTPAQAEASRHNGSHSTGPATPDGKARSSQNSTRHNLSGSSFRLLPEEDATRFASLRSALLTRHAPADEAEEHWVDELAFAMWRQRRLHDLEMRVLDALLAGAPDEPDACPLLPSLATLTRYRARIERDHRFALTELEHLQEQRRRQQPAAKPEQLRFLAEFLEQGGSTNEPEPAVVPEPTPILNRHERRRMAALSR